MIFNYAIMGLAATSLVLGAGAYIQTKRIQNFRSEIRSLERDIEDMEFGRVISENLRKENKILLEQKDQAIRELMDVKDYGDKLSDDLVRILGRVQRDNNGSERTSD